MVKGDGNQSIADPSSQKKTRGYSKILPPPQKKLLNLNDHEHSLVSDLKKKILTSFLPPK